MTYDDSGMPHRALDIRLSYRVELHRLRAGALVTNRSREAVSLKASWVFAADYADLLEAQDGQRKQHAAVERRADAERVRLRYLHDTLPFETILASAGPYTRCRKTRSMRGPAPSASTRTSSGGGR